MCLAAAMVGVLVFVRKRSLLGEALSHATYPGVTFAIVLAGFFSLESSLPILILAGAFLSALVGFWVIDRLEKKVKVASDAALGAVLSSFFGVGVTIASYVQNSYAHLYRQMQTYLYGQAATMTDIHVFIYGSLALVVIVFIALFHKQILALSFDPQFARTSGIAAQYFDAAIFALIVLSLVIGVRCVGVILMSAMLIAPAAAARQFTNRLSTLFLLAGIFGCISAFLGIYGSFELSNRLNGHYSLPTGPAIVLVSGGIALFALFFAPRRGLVSRYIRKAKFSSACVQENLLKALWRLSQRSATDIDFKEIVQRLGFSTFYLHWLLYRLRHQKTVIKKGSYYQLTPLGAKKGARIVRLHRLWEVYLVNSLGLKVERVHKSAEEMEHILTPELERKLTELLDNPKQDPHDQPIPTRDEALNVF
jgi:manganese/zinc/iron transport system permease protein